MTIEDLLSPIAGALPCGEDMSFSLEFDQIAEMRREDDPTLAQGDWVIALKSADWRGVRAACEQLLRERTKDLRLAQWFTEASALTQGYAGLAQGLHLCGMLCERFWDDLHPQPDHGDLEQRIGNLTWLLQRLTTLAADVPVAKGSQGQAHTLRHWRIARHPASAGAVASEAGSAHQKPAAEPFLRAVKDMPRQALLDQLQELRACQAALLRWQATVDARLGNDGPSFVAAKEALADALHDLEGVAREVGIAPASWSSPSSPTDTAASPHAIGLDAASSGTSAAAMAAGPLCSRAQALQQLREVADYFRRTEPHSPVAYLAEKAVKWGEMPLHEWLRKVIKDEGSMAHLQELLGIEPDGGPQPAY